MPTKKKCSRGNKKFAKEVNGKCIRFGDPNMTIKKNQPGRKKTFWRTVPSRSTSYTNGQATSSKLFQYCKI